MNSKHYSQQTKQSYLEVREVGPDLEHYYNWMALLEHFSRVEPPATAGAGPET